MPTTYLPDPTEGLGARISQLLLAMAEQRQQDEQLRIQRERLALDKKQADAAAQTQQAQTLQTQAGADQQLLAATMSGNPQLRAMAMPTLQSYANAQVPLPVSNANARALGTRPSPSEPSPLESKQAQLAQEAATERYLAQLRQHLSPVEYSKFEAGLGLEQAGVPKELVDWTIPETAREAAMRLKDLQEITKYGNERAADEGAFQILRDRYGILLGGPSGAQNVLSDMVLNDRLNAQARRLQEEKAGLDTTKELRGIETQIRNSFEQSQVTKLSQDLVYSYGKVLRLANQPAPTGPSDTALVFAFINMQDQTAARDAERRELQAAGSVEERITARFGRWKQGTLLSEEQRTGVALAAQEMWEAQKVAQESYTKWVSDNSSRSGVDPSHVTYDVLGEAEAKIQEDIARMKMSRALGNRRR